MKSLEEVIQSIQNLNIIRHILPDDGVFPNHALLPLLVYREAIRMPDGQGTAAIKEILETNGWTDAWVDGIYDYHHYHSTAHEVLVISNGTARVQFGGPGGVTVAVEEGDVVIIPAGVAHKKIEDADGFTCVGAYPDGQQYDINYGKQDERPRADENIKRLPLPENDPIYGKDGPLIKNWSGEKGVTSDTL